MRKKLFLNKGFSIVELAIVLGVIGTIIGGIWTYANIAYENIRREQAFESVVASVSNVRAYYQAQGSMQALGTKNEVPFLIQQNIIPNNMQRIAATAAQCQNTVTNGLFSCADTPWGQTVGGVQDNFGTFRVCDWLLGVNPVTAANGGGCALAVSATVPTPQTQFFGVQLRGLPIGACIQLAGRVSSASGPSGLYDVVFVSAAGVVTSIKGLGDSVAPVPTADLNKYCTSGTGNIVNFVYTLRAPST